MEKTLPEELRYYIEKWKDEKGSLLMILHEVQDFYGYVPKDISLALSEELDVPLARIYEVITFYNYFKDEEPAQYTIQVCTGTSCYLKGAAEIIKAIQKRLKVKLGKTSYDKKFKLEDVRCMGCCGLSPIMSVNGKVYEKLNEDKALEIIEKYIEKG